MLLKENKNQSAASPERNDSKAPLIDLNDIQELKSFEFDHSEGFVCDINTGICGPVIKEEEGKK
jgi:hypothetical protein